MKKILEVELIIIVLLCAIHFAKPFDEGHYDSFKIPDEKSILNSGFVVDEYPMIHYIKMSNVSIEEYDCYIESCIDLGYNNILLDIIDYANNGQFHAQFSTNRNVEIYLSYNGKDKTLLAYFLKK